MPRKPSRQKPGATVAIVGAGRLGTALGIALSRSGYRIKAVAARRLAHAQKAAAIIGRDTAALAANHLGLLPSSNIVLVSTPDDQIALTAQKLALAGVTPIRGASVLHTSGALSSDVLSPLAKFGFHVGSLHPLISVSNPLTGAETLRGAFYSVEGDAGALRSARAIVRALEGKSFAIPSRSKPLYHAAAVMASGHVVALFDLALELLRHCGLEQRQARQILLPLLESTVKNLLTTDGARALTGTFARGDLATVQRHLQALSKDKLADALKAYTLLGKRSLHLAGKKSIDPKLAAEITRALDLAVANKK
jgi:predicted short-subunit dehydrogenase-like oxidoreductase (DUF2520 family)